MRAGLRKALRITGWSLGSVILLLCTFVALLAFPGFLFAHKLERGNLVAYSNENLSGSLDPVLREIDRRLATSEIHDQELEHKIFFGHDTRVFSALQRARSEILFRATGIKPAPTYNVSWPPYVSHVVTFDVPDAAHDALRRSVWPGHFNMTHTLTHEVTHTLVLAKLGLANISRLPMWKAEGYPEYIAMSASRAKPGYSLHASATRVLNADLAWLKDSRGEFRPMRYDCVGKSYLKDENGDFWHTCYYLSRVLVEYLLDVRGLTFEQLARPSVDETQTLNELLVAYRAGELQLSRSP